MKIKDIKLHVIRPNFGSGSSRVLEIGVLRIVGEDGLEGYAFAGTCFHSGRPFFEPIVSVLKPRLLGRDVADREWLWSNVWTRHGRLAQGTKIPTAAWAVVDIAMWDLAGKAAGMPVYHMLGAQREKILAYASAPLLPGTEKTVDDYVEEAKGFVGRGFRGFKLSPGGPPGVVERARELARRLRDAVGDQVALMMDAGQRFSYQEALEIGLALDENRFAWFEDPIRHTDVDAMLELSRRLRTPIAVTDHDDFRFFEAAQYIKQGVARIIRNDAYRLGITGLKKLLSVCEAFGLDCEIHWAGNSLTNAANLHVMLSVANSEFYEILTPAKQFQFGLKQDITVDGEGYVHGPKAPGLGFEIDWELINRLAVEVL